jgi:molybdenum cofactor cytidylyltransferase
MPPAPDKLSPASASAPFSARFFAVVPAAGRSVRMGEPKLLLPWGESTIIESVLATWRASRVTRIVVVVHPADTRLAELCRTAGATVVQPEIPPPDMKASVGHALEWLAAHESPTEHDAWLLAPADMPLVTTAVIDAVIAAHNSAAPSIVAPAANDRRGHPVLFPWTLASEVARLAEHEGLNALVKRHSVHELPWPNAKEIMTDIDTPAEYQASQARKTSREGEAPAEP